MSLKSNLLPRKATSASAGKLAAAQTAFSRLSSVCPALRVAKLLVLSFFLSLGSTVSASAQNTGALAGSSVAVTSGRSVNLTSVGTSDWAHFGTSSQTKKFDHKALSGTTPVGLISKYVAVGTGKVGSYPQSLVSFHWTNGTPTASASTVAEVYTGNDGSGFSLTAPADTTPRTLTVYVGGYDNRAALTAHLSDGSAADFKDSSYGFNKPGNTNGHNYQAIYTLTYRAASAGQKLIVTWVQTSSVTTGANVNLQAATLALAPSETNSTLAAPTNLTAAPQWAKSCPVCSGMAMAHIVLAWDAVPGAASYTVYRDGTKLKDGLTSPAYTDMDVVSGVSYSYFVTAKDSTGDESQPSAPATATAPSNPNASSGTALISPTNLAVQGRLVGTDCTDVLSWTPAAGAVSYNVYQYGYLIGTTATTSFTVPLATYNSDLTYAVSAVDASGMESLPSVLAGAMLTFAPSNVPSWVSKSAPRVPTDVTATPEWNNGSPRVLLAWHGGGDAQSYNIYRDGVAVARGIWDLYYLDSAVQAGETHKYAVSAVNALWPGTLECARAYSPSVKVLSAVPAPLGIKIKITKVVSNDDSAVIFFEEIPGVTEYRVYDVRHPNKVKYAGIRASKTLGLSLPYTPIPLSIEWNAVDTVEGSDLVLEAVDKIGPFQIMDGMAGPGAMAMDGMMHQVINGQGDPSNIPNVLASSGTFHVNAAATVLTGSQVFFDNFRGAKPLTTLPMPPRDPKGSFYGVPYSYMSQSNDKWIVKHYGTDLTNSKVFFMGDHLMDTEFDGGGPGSSNPGHNNNASLIFQPKATADISGGKVLHVTFEVDAHFDSRRWCDLFISPAGDTLLNPGKFAQDDGGNNKATVSTKLFRWVIKNNHDVSMYDNGKETNLVQASNWNDGYTLARLGWDGSARTNGTPQDLDKRHRFDLYLSQTHYRIMETTPDGKYSIFRDKDFPAGTSLPFTQCQVYFVHQVYHTGNDRPELEQYSPWEGYWCNYRPWSDERHWDNMGFSVLDAFPK